MIENARNHPNITLDVEGFELHQDDIPEKLLNSIDFWNFQDVVTKLVQVVLFFTWQKKRLSENFEHLYRFFRNVALIFVTVSDIIQQLRNLSKK